MPYTIAFLNPWRNSAENQAFNSVRIAGERLGHTVVHCSNSMDIEACDPDFVLAIASTQAKLTRHPTFGVIHEGRPRFLLSREFFTNLLTYDGYLTISDTVRRFLENVLVGVGRRSEIGAFYNTPHRLTLSAPVRELAAERRLRLTYFGTNWDQRQWDLFQYLDREGLVEVYGPAKAWARLTGGSYRGAVPFDGEGPQRTYARNGAGLVLLSEQHLRDDVISNRVFEIVSVGAVALACDTPWLRQRFGDSLYYFDQRAAPARVGERLRDILREVAGDPAGAAERGRRARAIFEAEFSADVLLANAVRYFEAWRARRVAPDRRDHADVSVIVRAGGRSKAILGRALASLRDQTYGRVTAIVVLWRDMDPAALQQFATGAVVSLRIVKCLGGGRSTTLSAGLQAVETAYFAILDDDDAWFPTHLERAFEVFRDAPGTRLVITGAIQEAATAFPIMGGGQERRRVERFGFPGRGASAWQISAAFLAHTFVAESSLLDWRLLGDPNMATAEDSHLVLGLAAKATPRFSYAATAIQYQSGDGSHFLDHPQRHEDEVTLFTRRLSDLDWLVGPEAAWRLVNTSVTRALSGGDPSVKSLNGRTIYASPKIDYDTMRLDGIAGTSVPLEASRVELWGQSRLRDETRPGTPLATRLLEVIPPEDPWRYGATVDLGLSTPLADDGLLVVSGTILEGVLAFTLFDDTAQEPLFRRMLAPNGEAFDLHIPLVKGSSVGRLIMHNWEDTHGGRALIEGLIVYGVAPNASLAAKRDGEPARSAPSGERQEGDAWTEPDPALRAELARLRDDLKGARERIEAMETSKFWKLRRVWFRLRRAVGRGQGE